MTSNEHAENALTQTGEDNLASGKPPSAVWSSSDGLIVLALVFVTIKFTSGIERIQDIELEDEGVYLSTGYRLFDEGLRPRISAHLYSPLYAAWYFALSQVEPDPVRLYYLNLRVQSAAMSIAIFLLLRRFRIGTYLSAATAFVYIISYANLLISPHVSHVAILSILLSLIAASFTNRTSPKLACVAVGALCASYARPELFLGFLLVLACLSYTTWRGRKNAAAAVLAPIAATITLATILALSLGLPLGEQGRLRLAFRQHFAVNWIEQSGQDISAWSGHNTIAEQVFGDPYVGFIGAAYANPREVGLHIVNNIARIPKTAFKVLFYHASVITPRSLQILEALLLSGLAAVAAILSMYRKRTKLAPRLRSIRATACALTCLLIPIAATIVLIFPRPHYMLMAGVFTALLLILWLAPRQSRRLTLRETWPAALLLMIATPNAYSLIDPESTLDTRSTIEAIRSLEVEDDVHLLEFAGGVSNYLGRNYHAVGFFEKPASEGFDAFSARKKINMVFYTGEWRHSNRFSNDDEWIAFIEHPDQFGFQELNIAVGDARILVHRSLLESKD